MGLFLKKLNYFNHLLCNLEPGIIQIFILIQVFEIIWFLTFSKTVF